MYMKKNRGFSLVEICIAVGLMGIMLSIGGLKLRNHVAIAKNVKAASMLKSLRTAGEIYYSEYGEPPFISVDGESGDPVVDGIKRLETYLDAKTFEAIKEGKIPIGGSKNKDGEVGYGGYAIIALQKPGETQRKEGVNVWLTHSFPAKNSPEKFIYDIKGVEWTQY